jgi:uncharacterized protein YndB with AHSA1/START domain
MNSFIQSTPIIWIFKKSRSKKRSHLPWTSVFLLNNIEKTEAMITIQTNVKNTLEKVWSAFVLPEHITQWNFAGEDWHCPNATNNLTVGGQLNARMEAKDGSIGFDLIGIYDEIIPLEKIAYHFEDGRKIMVTFEKTDDGILVTESFDPENIHSEEMQRAGWSMILENFRKHAESIH